MSLFRARRAPERRDYVSSAVIPRNSDGWANSSGVYVNTDSALRQAAVYGSVSLIANALATTPIDVYRKRNGQREELETPALLDLPSGDLEPVDWLTQVFASVGLRGNTYGFKDNLDSLGHPREIHLIHPDDASVRRRSNEDPEPVYRFNGEEVPRRRVFHMTGFRMPGSLEGLSPVAYFAQTIGMAIAAEEYAGDFYGGGGHPSAVLESDQPISQPQAEAILARIMSKLTSSRRREPLVLGAGTTWKPIQIPPGESMFLDAAKFSALQIASMIFHIPASHLALAVEGSSLTYSNREQDWINLQTMALLPWAVRFEQHISRLLPGKQFVKFNMDAAVRVDLTTRYKAHEIGIRSRFLHPDEARELEDRKPLTPAQAADLKPAAPAAPTPPKEDTPDE